MSLFGTSTPLRYGMMANAYPQGDFIAGDAFGVGASGLSGCRYGTGLKKTEPGALFGHLAETNLGLAHDAKSPYR